MLLPHYWPPTAPFSHWLERTRDRVHHQLLRRLAEDTESARRCADWRLVEVLASSSLELDPFNESATLFLAEALARTGSKHKAVSLLQDFEHEVGRSDEALVLPARLLRRRLTESPGRVSQLPAVPLIGRSLEIARLTELWSRSLNDQFTMLVVNGEQSIGKTRLVSEFLSMVRVDGSGVVLSTRRLPADRHRPMSLFADICKQLICLPGAAGCSPRSIPYFERLTDAPAQHLRGYSEDGDAEYSDNAVRHAVTDLFESVCSEKPLLCHVDDADQLDDSSIAVLGFLQDQLSTRPLLFVLACERKERLVALTASHLRIEPLGASHSRELAGTMAAVSRISMPEEVLSRATELSGGNPGYLELLLGHAARGHRIEEAPDDLVCLIDDRISRLSIQALHCVQACAIFGAECSADVLTALTGLDQYDLLSALQELDDRSLLLHSASGVACRSVLVEERAQSVASDAVRSLMHRRAARFLEANIDAMTPTQSLAWRIAAHWDDAGDSASALRWRKVCWHQLITIGKPLAAAGSIRLQLKESTLLSVARRCWIY